LNKGSGIMDLPSVIQSGPSTDKVTKSKDKDNPEKSQSTLEELIKQEEKELTSLKKQIDDYIEKNGLVSELETKLNMSQLVITISDNALFAPAQATVKPEAKELAYAI